MVLKRTAKDIMTDTVIVAKADMIVTDVIKLLLRWHISGLPVVDDEGNLMGIITEHDILNFAISGDAADTLVSEVMTMNVEKYSSDTLVVEVINYFAAHRTRRVPVVENGKVIGIISRRDILREMNRIYSELVVQEDIEVEI
ncbi:HPP family protein [Chloroflexota bacterium]